MEHLVVGMDGSDGARAALEWASRVAGATGAEVIAVEAVSVPVYPALGVEAAMPVLQESTRAQIATAVEKWCAPLEEAAVPYRVVVREGNPAIVLEIVAREEHADAIVVGRRGAGGFARLVLGSVSSQLAHHSEVPVVVVPPAIEVVA